METLPVAFGFDKLCYFLLCLGKQGTFKSKKEVNLKKGEIDVFFVDVGNVLANFYPEKFFANMSAVSCLPVSVIRDVDESVLSKDWPDLECGRIMPYDFFCRWSQVLKSLMPEDKKEEFSRNFNFCVFRRIFGDIFKLRPKTLNFVIFLRKLGCKVFVISNSNHIHYDSVKTQFPKIFTSVDGLFLSHKLGFRKPETQFWQISLDSVGVSAERVFVVDDLEENVNSAKMLGINGAVFTNVESLKKDLEQFGFSFEKN